MYKLCLGGFQIHQCIVHHLQGVHRPQHFPMFCELQLWVSSASDDTADQLAVFGEVYAWEPVFWKQASQLPGKKGALPVGESQKIHRGGLSHWSSYENFMTNTKNWYSKEAFKEKCSIWDFVSTDLPSSSFSLLANGLSLILLSSLKEGFLFLIFWSCSVRELGLFTFTALQFSPVQWVHHMLCWLYNDD